MPTTCRQPMVFLLIMVVCFFAYPSPALPAHEDQTAVLLFISSETTNDLPIPVGDVREFSINTLRKHISSHDLTVLPSKLMDEAVGHWRVRSDWAINGPFLDNLAGVHKVTRVLVVHLRAEHSRLSLVTRLLDCPSGQLLGVELFSSEISRSDIPGQESDTNAWMHRLAELYRSIDPMSHTPIVAPTVLILPAQEVGCEPDHALTATAGVLKQMLTEHRWVIPDPALVSTTLSKAGIDPAQLGLQGRRLLQKNFNTDILFRLDLIAYGEGVSHSVLRIIDDDPTRISRPSLSDFDLIMRQINLRDGAVTRSHNIFVSAAGKTGWFGLTHVSSTQEKINMASENLWQAFNNHSKDH